MKSLYLILNIGSIIIPLAYSIFEKKFHFFKHYKAAFGAILCMAVPFLMWDAIFTSQAIWGFNEHYYLGFKILSMPIEEWLFFICIPYACLFSHEALKYYNENWGISLKWSKYISLALILVSTITALSHIDRAYTFLNYLVFAIILSIAYLYKPKELARYYPSFLIILIPFLIINGVLTGSFIPEEVVWYDHTENLNIRVGTIPIEDFAYAFSMLFSVQFLFLNFKRKADKTTN